MNQALNSSPESEKKKNKKKIKYGHFLMEEEEIFAGEQNCVLRTRYYADRCQPVVSTSSVDIPWAISHCVFRTQCWD